MKRRNTETKGVRIKTFQHFIPQSDLTTEKTQVVVYFKADNGLFYIYDGAHMFDTVREEAGKSYDSRGCSIFSNMITSHTLDDIIKGFESICTLYDRAMRDAAKKKVIRFTFKRNRKWTPDRHGASDINFCETPAVHFQYEVLYRVGDLVYSKEEDSTQLHYRGHYNQGRGRDGAATTVDWSEEREAFFENMQNSLIALIDRVEDFQSNLVENMDKAIAANTSLLLEHKS